MKAVRSTGDLATKVTVDEVEEAPGDGETIAVRSASICSSDLLYIGYGLQRILGHEVAGVRSDGTPVVVEAIFGCGDCPACRSGRYNLCPTHTDRALGVTIDGGMAEQYRAPADRLIPLPDGLDPEDASIVEPAAVAWHAVRLGGADPASSVAVVGAGGLGLLAAASARHQGAAQVAIEARHPHQRVAAERLGAQVGTSGTYDIVVEAAGSEESQPSQGCSRTTSHLVGLVSPRSGFRSRRGRSSKTSFAPRPTVRSTRVWTSTMSSTSC